MDEVELAWAAGLFDGEGTTSISRSKEGRAKMRLQLPNTEMELLIRWQRAMAAGSIYKHNNDSRPATHKQSWKVMIQRQDEVNRAIALLRPRVCGPKREQMDRAMAQMADNPPAVDRWKRTWASRRSIHGSSGRVRPMTLRHRFIIQTLNDDPEKEWSPATLAARAIEFGLEHETQQRVAHEYARLLRRILGYGWIENPRWGYYVAARDPLEGTQQPPFYIDEAA